MMISVIVPVYKVEHYLRRCVDSILKQTYKDYEILLVDDGSPDGSGLICDEYAACFSRVRVIHKENGGLSDARNVGILQATGEYVTFIDSDDCVRDDYLSELVRLLREKDAEIACGSFYYFSSTLPDVKQEKKIREDRVYTGKDACIALMMEKDFYPSACCMLIPIQIAKDHLFPVGKYYEDERTTFRYLLAAQKVAITDQMLYDYDQREGSIMHTFGQPVLDGLSAADYYVEHCSGLGDAALLEAARVKQYSLTAGILREYPELRDHYPDLYREKTELLRKNGIRMMLHPNVSKRIRWTGLNAVVGRLK